MSSNLDVRTAPLSGRNLVEASAGTGKTYNITALFLRLVAEEDLKPEQILVVSFTRAATQELKSRISERLRKALRVLEGHEQPPRSDEFLNRFCRDHLSDTGVAGRLRDAADRMDHAAIYTIHSFCQQVLQDFMFQSRSLFDVSFLADESELTQEVVDDYWRERMKRAEESPHLYHPMLTWLSDEIGTPDKLVNDWITPLKGKPFVRLYGEDQYGPLDEELDRFSEAFTQAANAFNQGYDQLHSILFDNSPLDGNKYRKNSVPVWLELMQGLFEGHPQLPDSTELARQAFNKFTPEAIQDGVRKGQTPPDHPLFPACSELVECAGRLRTVFALDAVRWYRAHIDEKKRQQKVRSYNDLLLELDRALECNPDLAAELRRQYPAALIDEFQDTDPVQYSIFHKLYMQEEAQKHSLIFLIGDPKQSIYSFRGADIFSYMQARNEVDTRYRLSRNFRTIEPLVQAVNRLMSEQSDRPFLYEIPYEAATAEHKGNEISLDEDTVESSPLQLLVDADPEQVITNQDDALRRTARNTAAELSRLLRCSAEGAYTIPDPQTGEKRPLKSTDIAVLTGRHRESGYIREALEELGIRCVDYAQDSVFNTEEAGDMLLLLHAVREPSNSALIRTLLVSPMVGCTISRLQALQENEQDWLAFIEHIQALNERFQRAGFMPMFRAFLHRRPGGRDRGESPIQTMLSHKRGERRLTNLMHLAELLNDEHREQGGGLEDLTKWLARQQHEAEQGEEQQLRLESDEHLVRIITMHSSKGLEFPVVFCPFLWAGRNEVNAPKAPFIWTDVSAGESHRYADLTGQSGPEGREKVFRQMLSERIRLTYVALTRARYRCYVGWTAFRSNQSKGISPLTCLALTSEERDRAIQAVLAEDKKSLPDPVSMLHQLRGFADRHEEIGITAAPEPQTLETGEQDEDREQAATRTLQHPERLRARWQVTSYSSLKKGGGDAPFDPFADEGFYEEAPVDEEGEAAGEAGQPGAGSLFAFPRGAQPGIFLHQLFEEIDFTMADEAISPVVNRLMARHDIDAGWHDALSRMIRSVLNRDLGAARDAETGGGLRLSGLQEGQLVKEMEFYYRFEQARLEEITDIMNDKPVRVTAGNGMGYLKGYIDLVFEHNGAYYILDYKSDHLGASPEDYHPERLQQHMQGSGYDLQYHLYSAALMRHLGRHLDDFDYQKHFGGVYYLFLRGIAETDDGRYGVFFDRPDPGRMRRLERYFSGAGDASSGAHETGGGSSGAHRQQTSKES